MSGKVIVNNPMELAVYFQRFLKAAGGKNERIIERIYGSNRQTSFFRTKLLDWKA